MRNVTLPRATGRFFSWTTKSYHLGPSGHAIVLRANHASRSIPWKQIEWQTLKASLTFCFVAWWPWIFGTALPPPPQKKKQEKNRSHLLGFDDSFVYLSIILLETILKPHVFLSSSLWSGSQQQIKKAFYNVLKLESLYVPLSCQVDSSELDPFPVRFQLSAKFVLQFVEMLLRLSKSRSDQDKVCWSLQATEIMLDSNIKIETA